MKDTPDELGPNLAGLSAPEWRAALTEMGEATGYFEPLGADHFALFTMGAPILLVSFASGAELRAAPGGMPPGLVMAQDSGWSHLQIVAEGETWFRDPAVYAYFDRLVDDAFFDEFDRVVFVGEGMGGYGAAAYSVAAPGASVILLRPQATLDPRLAGWDERFANHRRLGFTDRYGFAPDMIEAADRAWVIFDPEERLDAMHAALFGRVNARLMRVRGLGGDLGHCLTQMGIYDDLIEAAMEGGRMREIGFWRAWRARRAYMPWLRATLDRCEAKGSALRVFKLARHVTGTQKSAPKFRKAMLRAEKTLRAEARRVPAPLSERVSSGAVL